MIAIISIFSQQCLLILASNAKQEKNVSLTLEKKLNIFLHLQIVIIYKFQRYFQKHVQLTAEYSKFTRYKNHIFIQQQ